MHRFLCLICLLGCSIDHAGLIPIDSSSVDTGPVDAGLPDITDQPDVRPDPDGGPSECNDNDIRICGNDAVGECQPGRETCIGGRWSACRGGIGPGTEVCDEDGRDENCDGMSNEICECEPGMTQRCGTEVGECSFGESLCGVDSAWGPCSEALTTGDEVCNGLDDDCNGTTDEGLLTTYYLDEDDDGYGVGAIPMEACSLPSGYATVAGDCVDSGLNSDEIYPDAMERCNGQDDDCDGKFDEGLTPVIYYVDGDGDGFGAGPEILFCADPGDEYTTVPGDCDDTTDAAYPGGMEVCDTIDNDCSGGFDEGDVCDCPGVNHGDHNYLFCVRDRDWEGSRNSCPGQAGGRYRLVIINDAAEQVFVQDEASFYGSDLRWWIGLDDNEDEGDFRWVDGTPQRNGSTILSYDHFAGGEPNDDWGEDCVEIRPGGFWNDRDCGDGASFICESFEP